MHAAGSQIDEHRHLLPLEVRGRLRRAFVVGTAAFEEHDAAHLDAGPREIELRAGPPGDGHQPAPVRIAAVDGRLHQGRVRNRARRPARAGVGGAAGHAHRHQLGGAFAAAHDPERQLEAHLPQRVHEAMVVGRLHPDAARAVGEQEHGVVGRRLAVHRDRVEGVVARIDQRLPQHGGVHARVGGEEGEHRRQVRLDHARALRHAADRHGAAGELRAHRVLLGERIGRHDRAGRRRVVGGVELLRRVDDAGAHHARIELHTDDAGGGHQHVLGLALQRARRLGAHQARHLETGRTGARVGAAAVDDNRAGASAGGLEVLARDEHRRGRREVRGEQAGGRGGRRAGHNRQVECPAALDAGRHARRHEAGRRRDAATDDAAHRGSTFR